MNSVNELKGRLVESCVYTCDELSRIVASLSFPILLVPGWLQTHRDCLSLPPRSWDYILVFEFHFQNILVKLGVLCTCNPRIWEVEAERLGTDLGYIRPGLEQHCVSRGRFI